MVFEPASDDLGLEGDRPSRHREAGDQTPLAARSKERFLEGFRLESDCSDIFRCPFPRSRKQHRCDGMELANRPQHGPVRNRRDTNGNVDYYRRAGPSISGGSHGQLRYGFGITLGSVANAYIQCRGVCHRGRTVQFSVVSLAFTISFLNRLNIGRQHLNTIFSNYFLDGFCVKKFRSPDLERKQIATEITEGTLVKAPSARALASGTERS